HAGFSVYNRRRSLTCWARISQSSSTKMQPPARAFIFDLDGTLADTMPSHFVAWTRVAERHGLVFPEPRFYSLGGVPTEKNAAMLITEAGLTLEPRVIALEKEQTYYDALGP